MPRSIAHPGGLDQIVTLPLGEYELSCELDREGGGQDRFSRHASIVTTGTAAVVDVTRP